MTPLWQNFALFVSTHCCPFICHISLPSISVPNLKFLASFVPEILGGPKMHIKCVPWHHMSPFDLIFHCIVSTRCHPSLCKIRGPKLENYVKWHPHDPFWHYIAFLLTAIHLCAKFDHSSFSRSGYIRVSQNYESGSLDPHMTPFDLILRFLVSTHIHTSLCQIWSF